MLPVGVGAQDGDSQDEVHHDGQEDHAEAQQDGSVLPGPQSCHRLPPVQDLILSDLLVDGTKKKKKINSLKCVPYFGPQPGNVCSV